MAKLFSSLKSSEIKESGFDYGDYKGFSVCVSYFGGCFDLTICVPTATPEEDHDGSVHIYAGSCISSFEEVKEEVKYVISDLKENYSISNGGQVKLKALEVGDYSDESFIEDNFGA